VIPSVRRVAAALAAALALTAAAAPAAFAGQGRHGHDQRDRTLRFATFNASVNRNAAGQLVADLSTGQDPQLRNVAEIIQRARPDVLLVNEFDFYPDEQAARLFQRN
jgi:ABC-type phosphate transport system substrate-binding protein